jgi:hypothetical protein
MFLLLCLSVQGKYLPRDLTITNILDSIPMSVHVHLIHQFTSMCQFRVVDGGYIKALLRQVYSYQLQHIIQELELETI